MSVTKVIKIKVDVDGDKNVEKLEKDFKNVDNSIKDTNASTKSMGNSLDKATGGAITKFNAFKGSLKSVAGGFKTLRTAIISTGIGALVIAVTSLIAAFKRSEEGQNKFAKLMGVIGAVTGQFLDLIADLGENIISAFENPKKAIKDFVNLIKNNIITRFKGLLELLPKLGKAITLLFSGEFSEAGKVAADAVGKVALGVDSITDSFNEATEAVKNFAKETLKEANIAANIADKRAKADKKERSLIVARAKANRDIAELREKAADKENILVEDRIKALEEAAKIEEAITKREIEASNLRLSAKVAENALGKSTKADLDEEANLRARVIDLETARLRKQKALTAEVTTARREANSELEAERKKLLEERKAEIGSILQLEGQAKIQNAITTAEQIEKIDTGIYVNREKISEEDRRREDALADYKVQTAGNVLNALDGIAEEGSAGAKGIAIAQAVLSTYQGINKALAETTDFTPSQTLRFANAAAVGIAGFANVAKILSTDSSGKSKPNFASASSGGGGASAPSFNVVGTSGVNQLAESLQQDQQPVQAYVVGSNVTSQQELDRNIVDTVSLG